MLIIYPLYFPCEGWGALEKKILCCNILIKLKNGRSHCNDYISNLIIKRHRAANDISSINFT